MSAPKGNKNAKGNAGGKSRNDRDLAARVRTLALKEIEAALKSKDDPQFKQQVLLKLATGILPRLTEVSGELTHNFKLTDLFNATLND